MGRYGDLRRFNFVFDAESCRRTIEQSCWSREDFRPDTTVRAVQRLAGQLGDVLVVMSGYNDSSDRSTTPSTPSWRKRSGRRSRT